MAITARTTLLLLLLAPVLGSCASAPPTRWENLNVTQARADMDTGACTMTANQSQMAAWGAPRWSREEMAQSIFDSCMQARGYHRAGPAGG